MRIGWGTGSAAKMSSSNAFLSGEGALEILCEGSLPLKPVRSVITPLIPDTQPPPEAARRMIETIAHPLNRVVIDPVTGIRQRGFTIIQLRVGIALPGAVTATRFTRVFADTNGTDPYCQCGLSMRSRTCLAKACSTAKAIVYDLHAFRKTLGDRFPSELLLWSHDLIEGAHAGVGLATGIETTRKTRPWIMPQLQLA